MIPAPRAARLSEPGFTRSIVSTHGQSRTVLLVESSHVPLEPLLLVKYFRGSKSLSSDESTNLLLASLSAISTGTGSDAATLSRSKISSIVSGDSSRRLFFRLVVIDYSYRPMVFELSETHEAFSPT
jgi:hypothetical protein